MKNKYCHVQSPNDASCSVFEKEKEDLSPGRKKYEPAKL